LEFADIPGSRAKNKLFFKHKASSYTMNIWRSSCFVKNMLISQHYFAMLDLETAVGLPLSFSNWAYVRQGSIFRRMVHW